MGYNATTDTFSGAWDYYAEQLIMYVLGAGAPKSEYRIDPRMMYDFARNKGTYGDGEPFHLFLLRFDFHLSVLSRVCGFPR